MGNDPVWYIVKAALTSLISILIFIWFISNDYLLVSYDDRFVEVKSIHSDRGACLAVLEDTMNQGPQPTRLTCIPQSLKE